MALTDKDLEKIREVVREELEALLHPSARRPPQPLGEPYDQENPPPDLSESLE